MSFDDPFADDPFSDAPATVTMPKRRKPKKKPTIRAGEDFSLRSCDGRTEVANGKRLVQARGNDFRYIPAWKQYICWDGKRWEPDQANRMAAFGKVVLGGLWQEIGLVAPLLEQWEVDECIRFAKATGQARGIHAMIDMAKSERGVTISHDALDTHPYLLNCPNGTVDLRTGQLKPHDRADFLTKLCPTKYDPEAKCPIWEATLFRVMGDSEAMFRYMQRALGYSLTGNVSEHCLFIPYGKGANGKSTVLGAVQHVMGSGYAMQAVSDLLMTKRSESHPTERADLFGMRFVATIETESERSIAEALVKQLTGGDRIRARWCHKDFFEFDPAHKIWLATNYRPTITGMDDGIWRRPRLIPFTVTIPKEERDKELPDKLKGEAEGILAWLVRGCRDWREKGLAEPEQVLTATSDYRKEMDTVGVFIAECCTIHSEVKVKASSLFNGYLKWCESSGEEALKQRRFGDRVQDLGFERKRSNGYWYKGLALQAEESETESWND